MKFQESYKIQRIDSAADCEKQYRGGLSNVRTTYSNVLMEAQRTGEIFPGRPEVRPRIGFGASGKDENMRSYHKHYVA